MFLFGIIFYFMALKKDIFEPNVVRDLIRILPDNLVRELLNARGKPLTDEEFHLCTKGVRVWAMEQSHCRNYLYVDTRISPYYDGNVLEARAFRSTKWH
jgi:hypothetical protein